MAYYSIEKRQRADGTLRYHCTVGVKEGGEQGQVAERGTNGVPTKNDAGKMTIGDRLKHYINDPNPSGKAGRTKRYVLDCDIAGILTYRPFNQPHYCALLPEKRCWCSTRPLLITM